MDFEHDSLIATHNVPMLQNVQGTGIHRPIQKSLNLLSHLHGIFPLPQLHENILYHIFRIFFPHNACGIEQQVGIIPAEKGFICQVEMFIHMLAGYRGLYHA